MKNAKILNKLSRLTKIFFVSLLFASFAITFSSFKLSVSSDTDPKKSAKDSLQSDKSGFLNLFANSEFDPARPYIAQLNPLAVPFVENYIKKHTTLMNYVKVWGKPYLDMYDGILGFYGLPKELKYLSVIESNLKSKVTSISGAVGPWQIMSPEARRQGLKVNGRSDERTSYSKSTHAAAKILKELYTKFGDWLLVIAAYNAGSGRISQAVRKSGSKNFWILQKFLPLETRNHVKKFIATHYIFEGNGGLTTSTAAETEALRLSYPPSDEIELSFKNEEGIEIREISGRYSSGVLIKSLGIDGNQFFKLNPDFDKAVSSGNVYKLRLPTDKMKIFEVRRQTILHETIQSLLASPSLK